MHSLVLSLSLFAILATAIALFYLGAINFVAAFTALIFALVAASAAKHCKWIGNNHFLILYPIISTGIVPLILGTADRPLPETIFDTLPVFIVIFVVVLFATLSPFMSLASSAELEKYYIKEKKQLRTFLSDCLIAVLVPAVLIAGDFGAFGEVHAHTVILVAVLFLVIFAPNLVTRQYIRWCEKKQQDTQNASLFWNILYYFSQVAPLIAMLATFV